MNHAPRLAALAGLLVSLGCGRAQPSRARAPAAEDAAYDAQACVEGALRRSPDPALLPDAYDQFSAWCSHGDSGSCSTLGVMVELGLGARRDPRRARALYLHACEAGNARACANLDALTPRAGPRTVVAGARDR